MKQQQQQNVTAEPVGKQSHHSWITGHTVPGESDRGGPGRRGHGHQAEWPRRQRPHPRLLGLGTALRRRARARGGPRRDQPDPGGGGRGDTGGARGGAGDQPDPGGGEPAAAQAASVPATPHSRSLGGAVDSAMGGRAAQSAAAAQADTGCGRDTQAGPGMGSARDRPLAGDPQRCATTGSGPIWGSPPIDAKDGAKTPACREQLNRPVMPHPFKIGDSV
ncbi:uncharacterized protein LOC143272218 [Peromyscus maniculatus bairdii]|uniref:uncharacterized protein LOC143272218 n=1 Tax=Peromyscus maniculatus bairdii TaxID=230844 RepID=UPI003FD1B393